MFAVADSSRSVLLQSFDSSWLTLLVSESTKYEDDMEICIMENYRDHDLIFTSSLVSNVVLCLLTHHKSLNLE
jgi:hypothetical protein